MNNFAFLLQKSLTREFNIDVDVYFSRRKLLHIDFKKSFVDSLYADLGKSLSFIRACQGKNGNVYLRIKKRGKNS